MPPAIAACTVKIAIKMAATVRPLIVKPSERAESISNDTVLRILLAVADLSLSPKCG
jgi:hypothetical protein